jgi:hypothetical protein
VRCHPRDTADAWSVRSRLWSNEQKHDLRQREKWEHHSSKHNGQQEWQQAGKVEPTLSSRFGAHLGGDAQMLRVE